MLVPSYKPEHPTYDDLEQILPPIHSTECLLTELPPILCKLAFSKLLGIHYLPHDAQHKSPGVVIWKILIFPTQLLPLGSRMRFHSLENPQDINQASYAKCVLKTLYRKVVEAAFITGW